MAVTINSYNEILGKLVRKIIAETSVNDINRGSVLLTLLEAVASQDFENSVNILSVLESLSIDALKNSDLDKRAADYGLSRTPAAKATGFVTIKDFAISKRSTSLYAVKSAPIAGTDKLYVNDASTWQSTGTLYIGRGTRQFEGPIDYSSIINNGSFYTINLSASLKYDHLISDVVVDAQGTTDRRIPAGTIVKIPANNQNPEILYSTLREAVLPSGEDSVSNIEIVANKVGSSSNAGINTIVAFTSLPFASAAVTNSTSLTDGRDTESDDDLRERIKAYTSTLSRGTREAILSAIIGISDSSDGKQVSSATIIEPAAIGQPSLIYVDDGSGFQPTYKGQSVDLLLSSATGGEEFLQLANFPLPRPQVINQADGPYSLTDGSSISVIVDDLEEEIVFSSSYFKNISAATLPEIVDAINDNSTNFKCRLTDNSSRLLLYPASHDSEFIQVVAYNSSKEYKNYANAYLKFPTNKYSYITLYKNNALLSEKESSATLTTVPKSNWEIVVDGNLIIEVDGTPAQDRSFSSLDFDGRSFSVLTVSDWVSVFNKKFAGIKASATTADQVQISSNLIGSNSSLKIIGGSYQTQMFGESDSYSQGKTSDFSLNRQTGNLQIKTKISAGDSITAGSADTKGNIISASTSGSYGLVSDSYGREASLVVIADGNNSIFRDDVSPVIGTTIQITVPVPNVMRIISNVNTLFAQAQVGDFIYITNRASDTSWLDAVNCGLFKIKSKGSHIVAGVDSWVEVDNSSVIANFPRTISSSDDIQVFYADAYPQIWKGSYLTSPGSATIKSIVESINSNLENIKASIYKTSSVKVTSTTENNGSIASPVSTGLMKNLFASGIDAVLGNQSNIATKVTNKDLVSFFKRTTPTSSGVWLNRYVYSDLRGLLSSGTTTNPEYSDELTLSAPLSTLDLSHDDVVSIVSGSNKSHFRNIKEYISSNKIGTQINTPNTILNYAPDNQMSLFESLDISSDDSAVFILDGDSVNKTVNVNFWRTGKVNLDYIASNTAFSANDAENESNVSFDYSQTWSTLNNYTDFRDYAIWFRSRNWYQTTDALGACLIIRAKEYGPTGDKITFKIEYPTSANQSSSIKHSNSPLGTDCTYTFASSDPLVTNITGGTSFTVDNITYISADTYRLAFNQSSVDLSSLTGNDIISISGENITAGNRGVFKIKSFDSVNRTIDIQNASGVETSVGSPASYRINQTGDILGTPGNVQISCTAQDSYYSKNIVLLNSSADQIFSIPAGCRFSTNPQCLIVDTTDSNYVYVGGSFSHYNDELVNGIVKINILTGQRDLSFNTGTGFLGNPLCFVIDGNSLYIGGGFSQYNGVDRANIAKINKNTGALDLTFDTTIGTNGSINSMAIDGSDLYAGGQFSGYKGKVRGNLIKINKASALEVDTDNTGFSNTTGFNDYVYSLAVDTTGLYASGRFSQYKGAGSNNRIAKINKSTSSLDAAFLLGTGFNNTVYSISLDSGYIYAGGDFTTYNGTNRQRVAKINKTDASLDATFDTSSGFNDTVYSVFFDSSNQSVYVGGFFTQYKTNTWQCLAKISSTNAQLDTLFNTTNGFDGINEGEGIRCLVKTSVGYLVGGDFYAYKKNLNNTVSSGDYFVLIDSLNRKIVYWYRVDGNGTNPNIFGAYQSIPIDISTADSPSIVAEKTSLVVNSAYADFESSYLSNTVTITNKFNGPITEDTSGQSLTNFLYAYTDGLENDTLGGKYFIVHDADGSVAIWMNVYSDAEPPHGADRSIQVVIPPGSNAFTVGSMIQSFVNADPKLNATLHASYVDIVNESNGFLPDGDAGTSGFVITKLANGEDNGAEVVNSNNDVVIFSITDNDAQTISDDITNNSSIITAVPVGDASKLFTKSTEDETISVAFDHVPGDYNIKLFDGESFVKEFSNTAPNFILKKELVLQGVNGFVYDMRGAPNPGTTEIGEFFKLIPKTVKNVKHHLSHRALSQLPIVADIDVCNNFRRIQIKSKKLGTSGSVEVVGGRANLGEFSVIGDAQIYNSSFIELKTSAYPFTIGTGDIVKLYNEKSSKRISRLQATDTIRVDTAVGGNSEYSYNKKSINSRHFTGWTITDVSVANGKTPGVLWKWEHDETGVGVSIVSKNTGSWSAAPNEYASGTFTPGTAALEVFSATNGSVSSSIVFSISVNSSTINQGDYFTFTHSDGYRFAVWFNIDSNNTPPDSVIGMVNTEYGNADSKIQIDILSSNTPNEIMNIVFNALAINANFTNRFNQSLLSATSLETVQPGDIVAAWGEVGSPFLSNWNTGNQIHATGDEEIAGFPVVSVDADQRYMLVANPTGVAMPSLTMPREGGNVEVFPTMAIRWRLKHSEYNTRYKIENIGFNNLVRVSCKNGDSPFFTDCGVAVDDFVKISGLTFSSFNNGFFRVLGVDNDSFIIENPNYKEELNTYTKFNNLNNPVTWVSNSTQVTGSAGSFANLQIGIWIKKKEDGDDHLVQVTGCNTLNFSTATTVTLGSKYKGVDSISVGVAVDQTNAIGQGVFLDSVNDLIFYSADSAIAGDSLVVENISNANWFKPSNTGVFEVLQLGTNPNTKGQFLRIFNTGAISQESIQMSVSADGFYLLENENYKYESIRKIEHTAISTLNSNQRVMYLSPPSQNYKISDINGSKIRSLGKIGFDIGTASGVDGYIYYTGLMQTVQKTIDGYEPDSSNYPGRRAVGSSIEVLPPLVKQISMTIDVVTKDGVNLTDVSNDIKSIIINYVNTLGVGEDVVLSEIIARIKIVTGIYAVTFTDPSPTELSIAISSNQKAFTSPDLINLS